MSHELHISGIVFYKSLLHRVSLIVLGWGDGGGDSPHWPKIFSLPPHIYFIFFAWLFLIFQNFPPKGDMESKKWKNKCIFFKLRAKSPPPNGGGLSPHAQLRTSGSMVVFVFFASSFITFKYIIGEFFYVWSHCWPFSWESHAR